MVATAIDSKTTAGVGADRVVSGGSQGASSEFKVAEPVKLTDAQKADLELKARKDLAVQVAVDLGAGLGATVREAAKQTSQLANNVDALNRGHQEREAAYLEAIERSQGSALHPATIQAMMNQQPAGGFNVRSLGPIRA
jgi:hypothetical protein